MTLSRALIWLILVLAIALPPQESAAMFGDTDGVSDDNDNDNDSEVPPPPDGDESLDEEERDANRAEALRDQEVQRAVAQSATLRHRRTIEASVALALLEADEDERPELADNLRQSDQFGRLMEPGRLAALEAAATASTATNSTSTRAAPAAAAVAKAASRAAAPAARAMRRGKATSLADATPETRQRAATRPAPAAAAPAEAAAPSPARIEQPDLGPTELRESHDALIAGLSTGSFVRRTDKQKRAKAVVDAHEDAAETLTSLQKPRLGRMPPALAEALISLAERGDGRDAQTGARSFFVPGLASATDGIDVEKIGETDSAAPIDRVAALEALADAAEAAAADYLTDDNDSPARDLYDALNALARDARDDRAKLVAFLNEVAQTYPHAFASIRVPAARLGGTVGSGQNAAPRAMRFNFAGDTVPASGPENAVFKQTEADIEADGSLFKTGVDTSGDVPLRLEQRSIATRRLADLLGIGDLVVDMRLAELDDPARTMGLVMERAGGEAGEVHRNGTPDPAQLARRNQLLARIAQADAMVAFLDAGGQGTPPDTGLIRGDDPTSDTWNRARWFKHSGDLNDAVLDVPIRQVDVNGTPTLIGVFVERAISDAHLANPDLRRQLSNAQWLDLLCGQVDRHMGNLFIDTRGAVPVVKLIDNDLAFGRDNAAYGLHRREATPNFQPPKPRVIDAALREKFLSLTGAQLREATQGLLIKAEQDALVGRMMMLQGYIRNSAVAVVRMPDTAPKSGGLRWTADPALLFLGAGRTDTRQNTGNYSYYSQLKALPERP